MRQVGQFIDKPGQLGNFPQLLIAYAVHAHLDFQVGYDGAEVGIAAPLAAAIDGALHLRAAALD